MQSFAEEKQVLDEFCSSLNDPKLLAQQMSQCTSQVQQHVIKSLSEVLQLQPLPQQQSQQSNEVEQLKLFQYMTKFQAAPGEKIIWVCPEHQTDLGKKQQIMKTMQPQIKEESNVMSFFYCCSAGRKLNK